MFAADAATNNKIFDLKQLKFKLRMISIISLVSRFIDTKAAMIRVD